MMRGAAAPRAAAESYFSGRKEECARCIPRLKAGSLWLDLASTNQHS